MKNKIVLIGMRGCGKSHFGSCLSSFLQWPKIDMDDAIEEEQGKTIPSIIEEKGWDYFRDTEHEMAKNVSSLDHVVISTGGGAITFERNQPYLKKDAIVVFLFAPFDELVRRLSKDSNKRPDLEKGVGVKDELRKSWAERKDIYFSMADLVFTPKPTLHKNIRKNVEKNAEVLGRKILSMLEEEKNR